MTERERILCLTAEQAIRDLCYDGGTLAGTARMQKYLDTIIGLVGDLGPQHQPACDWAALLSPKTEIEGGSVTGAEMIAAERQRQVEVEGWTREHDDEHTFGELAKRAAALAVAHTDAIVLDDGEQVKPWKMHREPRSLVIAGALIAAEIDRIHRSSGPLMDPGASDSKAHTT